MDQRNRDQIDWYLKLSTIPHLADDIADLLANHAEGCGARMAALYWIQRAGYTEEVFLTSWAAGTFNA